jgi:hypothetical protein
MRPSIASVEMTISWEAREKCANHNRKCRPFDCAARKKCVNRFAQDDKVTGVPGWVLMRRLRMR